MCSCFPHILPMRRRMRRSRQPHPHRRGHANDDQCVPSVPTQARLFYRKVPVCGNSFITHYDNEDSSKTRDCRGFDNWASPETIWTVFFRIEKTEPNIILGIRLRIPDKCQSTFMFSWDDDPIKYSVNVFDSKGGQFQDIKIGAREITEPGYVRVNFQGVSRSGDVFADVAYLLLASSIENNDIVFNISPKNPALGCSGPSVYLSYTVRTRPSPEFESDNQQYPIKLTPTPVPVKMDFYYSEATIPPGSDFRGLHAIAIGFCGGYLSLQVSGTTVRERQIVFYVRNEHNKDDPSQDPEQYKVKVIKYGAGIVAERSSGTQSVVNYEWETGSTYKFLVHSRPIDEDYTLYAAWFKTPDSLEWELISCLLKPRVSIYLSGFYSCLENLEPCQGIHERIAYFGNQWVRSSKGKWFEVVEAVFRGDSVSTLGRRDYAAGYLHYDSTKSNVFYLRHCGFFDDYVNVGKVFFRQPDKVLPDIPKSTSFRSLTNSEAV